MDQIIAIGIYFEVGPRLYEAAAALIARRTSTKQIEHQSSSRSPSSALSTITYHLKTIYLFTSSDLKTVLIPLVLFGIGHAIAAPLFNIPKSPSTSQILLRLPLVVLWLVLILLCFAISNQRSSSAISQDRINKPHRPFVTKRVDPAKSWELLMAATFTTYAVSYWIGGKHAAVALAILTYLYNDLGGSEHFVPRDLHNGLGILACGAGAMDVAMAGSLRYTPALVNWFAVTVCIVTLGIHIQDHCDRVGDALMGRKTVILVLGDSVSRWSVVASSIGSSILAPHYLQMSVYAYLLPMALALWVSYRTIYKTDVSSDKQSYKLWSVWLTVVYSLPLMKALC